ncbi:uncharacterized protein EKO05_0008811 [Ascochyta rabiei]|uniref:uncharacterized protein n=1 Tax=Didymella rabiei TaxID=5454 RepID=UPI00220AA2EB|nr:uncharacterized protein EKO05_0008811 [Ascochyta rabiei]UPX18512.1 hypothetical protein EKO05_0008811 [Ascochyta rabiei]
MYTLRESLEADSHQTPHSHKMADRCQSLRMKRTETAQSAGINYVIDVANSNDRFKLLEDDAVLPADLTNPVHPIFRQLEGEKQLHLALQLASQFLLHDRLLEFFVPLLFGRESFDLQHEKAYLNNPLVRASKAKQAQLLSAVREALQCLARRIEVCFVDHKKQRLYARTIANGVEPKVTSSCCRVFQQEVSPKIEVTDKFLQYYNSEDGYRKASWCARYRHDFLVATTLVHEVVHAVGVMRRGNLTEPHYQHDFPETEWGYAWENFMFGSIINPQDKTHLGTHLLMRKVWANARLADANGGKEYCDVPVSWIAQWFQNKTWDIVAKKGPTAIALPTTHFKIQISNELGAWVVSSDCPDVCKDVADLHKRWQRCCRQLTAEEPYLDGRRASCRIYHNTVTTSELQGSSIPVPQRVRNRTRRTGQPALLQKLWLSAAKAKEPTAKRPLGIDKPLHAAGTPLVAVCRAASPCNARKRGQAHDDNPMAIKRLCILEQPERKFI